MPIIAPSVRMVPEIAQPVYCPSSDIVRVLVSNHEYHDQLDESVNERGQAKLPAEFIFYPRIKFS